MSRLINADETIKNLAPLLKEYVKNPYAQGIIIGNIANQPTAYDVEKVVAELEQQAEQYGNRGFEYEKHRYSAMADEYYAKQCSYLHAIDIVRKGGVNEYDA